MYISLVKLVLYCISYPIDVLERRIELHFRSSDCFSTPDKWSCLDTCSCRFDGTTVDLVLEIIQRYFMLTSQRIRRCQGKKILRSDLERKFHTLAS